MEKRWYEENWACALFLILFAPMGLYLMWKYNPLNKIGKILITMFFIVLWGTVATNK